jgi:LiaI-LiaF-like transmembrane region
MRWRSSACTVRNLFRGVLFIVIGTFFLLANLGWSLPAMIKVWWPVIPIVLGAANVAAYAWRGPRNGRPYSDFA